MCITVSCCFDQYVSTNVNFLCFALFTDITTIYLGISINLQIFDHNSYYVDGNIPLHSFFNQCFKFEYRIIIMCLYTVIWYQLSPSNTTNVHTIELF